MTAPADVATIPAGASFVDVLASGLIEEAGDDLFQLADTLVLLPNRRACRALRDAFLRVGDGQPMLLPAMRPLGDTDEDQFLVAETPSETTIDVPPEIPPLQRQLLLAHLVREHSPDGEQISFDHAVRLASDLARLVDQAQTEGLTFDRLNDLVPARYAAHWQRTLELLHIVTARWPETLEAAGCADPADRRNRLLHALVDLWQRDPPRYRIVAAGSTGTIPAVARLLKCVANLPAGKVILPGLDQTLDEASAEAAEADPTHPQFGMLSLLRDLGVAPHDVVEYRRLHAPPQLIERRRLLNEAMRPAATSDAWRELRPFSEDAFSGLQRVDCPGEAEEAEVVALAMRHALENESKTAALVTPDRGLARRVAAALSRWDIEIDDSAGVPLQHSAPGMFFHLVAEMVQKRFAPVATLAALKHPLAAGGRSRSTFRDDVRLLERAVLRGPRPEPNLAGLRHAVPADLDRSTADRIDSLLGALEQAVGRFSEIMSLQSSSLAALLTAHVAATEALAFEGNGSDNGGLWVGEAGEALAEFIDEALHAAPTANAINPAIYPALLSAMMAGRVVRPRYGRHPRLHIWGPLEARLQNADLVVLGGLNEGNWPRDPDPDPWMSRPMQESFGLPLPERRIGLSAHDFVMAAAAPEVLLTRSEKSGGAPTVPSRWLSRLDAVMLAAAPNDVRAATTNWLDWARALYTPDAPLHPARPPSPCPPVSARPRRLSVTRIEAWMRDPYSIYARDILGLWPLDPLEADPAAADRGTIIHEALDRFVRDIPAALPDDAEARLLEIGRDVFARVAAHPVVHAFWWPRFERVARWFINIERRRRAAISVSETEIRGRMELNVEGTEFILTAVADRIDRLTDGGYAILDYKTGQPPSTADVEDGYAPQLPLEAAIALAGGFGDLPSRQIDSLAFWRLSGGEPAGEIKEVKGDLTALANDARAGLTALISTYADVATPYTAVPNAAKAPRFNDYEHLARIAEWAGVPDTDTA